MTTPSTIIATICRMLREGYGVYDIALEIDRTPAFVRFHIDRWRKAGKLMEILR